MNAKCCDRCGSYYKVNGYQKYIVEKDVNVLTTEYERIDLCPKCTNQLRDWLCKKVDLNEEEEKC